MPFIPQAAREELERRHPVSPAELSYCLTKQVAVFMRGKDLRYDDRAAIRAAIEGCLDEFLRKHLWPYEDAKELENGAIK